MSIFRATKLGMLLGCATSDPGSLEACMQQADALQVTMMQFAVLPESTVMFVPFAPVIDGFFLPDSIDVCFFLSISDTIFQFHTDTFHTWKYTPQFT